ncbi:MAG TPA: IS21 family transposase, partial [Candidatus Krumholzibacteria bacterium]|nr:IS21 family transposase [Candidatus Krumholzibacteria bacterium]
LLDPLAETIEAKVGQGLSAVQIYQDLCREIEGFPDSYETVKRAVRALRHEDPVVYCRMRYGPGEEAQIDFGELGRLPVAGHLRKVYVFAMTLCWGRHSHYELVCDQRVPTFLRAIRHGLEAFGGAPRRLKPDNLKSAVLIDRLGQRHYQEDFFRFCRHYGMVPKAARPATPTDKGRTEREIGYVKGNGFRGRRFASLEEARAHLARWHAEVADVRRHGTTRRRPWDLFEIERKHLLPLPEDRFEIADWGRYKVRKDCHIHVGGNYYSVPFALVGRPVLMRLRPNELDVFAEGELVATHPRAEGEGHDVTDPAHYPIAKRISSQEIHRRRVQAVREAGPQSAEFLRHLRGGSWVFGDQLARMARLVEAHGPDAVERACERALYFGATDGTRPLERILAAGLHAMPLPGRSRPAARSAHDYGRPLTEYDVLLLGEEAAA